MSESQVTRDVLDHLFHSTALFRWIYESVIRVARTSLTHTRAVFFLLIYDVLLVPLLLFLFDNFVLLRIILRSESI